MQAVGEASSVTLQPDRFTVQRRQLGGRVTLSCRGNCLVWLDTLESTPLQFWRNHGGNCLVCGGCRGALALRGPCKTRWGLLLGGGAGGPRYRAVNGIVVGTSMQRDGKLARRANIVYITWCGG
jgi:hypothetical protein